MCSLCECACGHQRTRSGTCPHLSFSLRPCVFLFSTVSQASWLTGPHGCSSLCLPPHCGSGAGGTQLHSPLWQMPYPLGHLPTPGYFPKGFHFHISLACGWGSKCHYFLYKKNQELDVPTGGAAGPYCDCIYMVFKGNKCLLSRGRVPDSAPCYSSQSSTVSNAFCLPQP